jgi:hypothetical protein
VRSGFVAFNMLAHVFDPAIPMSVSELKQIISAFVIVCGLSPLRSSLCYNHAVPHRLIALTI